ncbi:suppressor-like protein [Wolffia australiana]
MEASSSSGPADPFTVLPEAAQKTSEDTVFYAIFLDGASFSPSGDGAGDPLFALQLRILDTIIPSLLQDYIWQHEPFNLSLSHTATRPADRAIPHLHGKVRYGDNVEDEWLVVFLLREISARIPSVSIRVWDSDGEFLLIEAAFSLPRWINPGNSENRVFIRQGKLHILPKKQFPSNPSLREALAALESGKIQTAAPEEVQQALNRRISDYPERARRNTHRTRVRVPLAVAQVLKFEPAMISLAVEGFYDRDIDSMKHAAKMRRFLFGEGGAVDMVQTCVAMSRAMFAQLVRQRFSAPKCYPMPSREQGNVLYAEAELGMKIACGLEMMYQYRRQSGDDGGGSSVEAFKKALESRGFFEGLLPGSKAYRRRLDEAMEKHKNSVAFSRARDVLRAPVERIEEILSLPHSARDFVGGELPPSDDDSWLYDGEEELNSAILERQREMEAYELKRRGKETDFESSAAGDDFNLGEMAKTMQAFVQKISSFEGAEVPASRGTEEVELDVKQFFKEMESVLGDLSGLRASAHGRDSDGETSSSGFGLDDSEDEEEGDAGEEAADFMESYSQTLDAELRATTLKNSFLRASPESGSHAQGSLKTDSEADREELTAVDVDLNLVKGLIDSYSSQQGLPGPASNLLGLMGFTLPRDPEHSSL